ncbi:MAG: hypothetical protein ABSB81_03355 [Halobacteriota archaeon]|jgi:hypothetical protein
MTQEQACYYGLRIGCPNATNPNCRLCAERLTHAVDQMLRSMAASDGRTSNTTNESMIDDLAERFSDLSHAGYLRERS